MTNVQAVAAGRVGFVRAVFSQRCRGFAAPLDLLRGHLRAVVGSAWRRRVSAEFAGYLVTDAGQAVEAVEPVPTVWRWPDTGRVMFLGRVRTGRAAGGDDEQLRPEFEGELSGAAIDAPAFCLSGATEQYVTVSGERCALVGRFLRPGLW